MLANQAPLDNGIIEKEGKAEVAAAITPERKKSLSMSRTEKEDVGQEDRKLAPLEEEVREGGVKKEQKASAPASAQDREKVSPSQFKDTSDSSSENREERRQDEGETLMGFGKYHDKSFRQVYSSHRSYYHWRRSLPDPGPGIK